MVDMHTEDEENSTTQGATALVKRCMRVYNWSLEKTRKVLTAYRQFLTLKKEHKDWDATILSPSYLVDQMWHQHILDVVNYTHDMMLLCGHVVGHNPDGALNLQKKAERDETTHIALEKRFANKYDKEIWGIVEIKKERDVTIKTEEGDTTDDNTEGGDDKPINIRVKDTNCEETMFKIKRSTKFKKLFSAYASREGVNVINLSFMLDGENINPEVTPAYLDLEDDDQIDVILRQCGC